MQYRIRELVVHLAHGVGQIASLETKQFGGEARLYYEVVTQKSTVWVPVESTTGSTLRPITPKAELDGYKQLLKDKPSTLNADRRQRQADLNERLKGGSFRTLCEAMRDLSAHGWRKPLSEADNAFLRRIYDNLCQEWAAAAGISLADANAQINALLFEAKRVHLTVS